jgi:hypothetical protein
MKEYFNYIKLLTFPILGDVKILMTRNYFMLAIVFFVLFLSNFTSNYHEYVLLMVLAIAIKEETFQNIIPYFIQNQFIQIWCGIVLIMCAILYGMDIYTFFNPSDAEETTKSSSLFTLLLFLSIALMFSVLICFLVLYVIFLGYAVSFGLEDYQHKITLFDLFYIFKKNAAWLLMWWPIAILNAIGIAIIIYVDNEMVHQVLDTLCRTCLLYYCSAIAMRYIFNKPPEPPMKEEKQHKTVEAM